MITYSGFGEVKILGIKENQIFCETENGGRIFVDDRKKLKATGGQKEISMAIEAATKNDHIPSVVNAHPIKKSTHNDFRDKDINDLKLFQDLDINLSSNDKRNVVVVQQQNVEINLYQACHKEINRVGMNVFLDKLNKEAIKYKI